MYMRNCSTALLQSSFNLNVRAKYKFKVELIDEIMHI